MYDDDEQEEIKTNVKSKPRKRVNNKKVYDDDDLDDYDSDRSINEMDAYKNVVRNRLGHKKMH